VVMDEEEYKNYEMFKAMKNVMSGKW
jgi:hypothetical protein